MPLENKTLKTKIDSKEPATNIFTKPTFLKKKKKHYLLITKKKARNSIKLQANSFYKKQQCMLNYYLLLNICISS
jgi:hypothetical protein